MGSIDYQITSQMSTKRTVKMTFTSKLKWLSSQRSGQRPKKINKLQTLVRGEGPFSINRTRLPSIRSQKNSFILEVGISKKTHKSSSIFSLWRRQQATKTRAVNSQISNTLFILRLSILGLFSSQIHSSSSNYIELEDCFNCIQNSEIVPIHNINTKFDLLLNFCLIFFRREIWFTMLYPNITV